MAVNRIRGAFAAPRKGETFELRAGLVYVSYNTLNLKLTSPAHNMLTNGMRIPISSTDLTNVLQGKKLFRKRSWR